MSTPTEEATPRIEAAPPDPAVVLPEQDVRRKRPPALAFVLRWETVRRLARVLSLLALDGVAVFLAIFGALALKGALRNGIDLDSTLDQTRDYVAFALLVTWLLFARSDLYAERGRRPGLSKIAACLFQVAIVALIFALANGEKFTSYYIFYGSFFFAVVIDSTFRFVYEKATGAVLHRAGYRRRAVLVGTGKHIESVAHALSRAAGAEVEVVGFVSLTPRPNNGLRSLGTLDELPAILTEHRVQEVIIADHDFPQEQAVVLVDQCHERGVVVRIAPSTMEILVQRAEFVAGQSVPLFELKPPVFEGIDYLVKRSFDVLGSALLLLVASPLLLGCALAVKFSSRGPVFYRSPRPGLGGQPFVCLKFRTMESNAEQLQADLEGMNEKTGGLFKIRADPRLTGAGSFLRRYSLDELPQLINVLRGEMSLVGPRPLTMRDYEQLAEWHKKRYLVLPGITGLWQVSGRGDLDFDDLVRLDFIYLERWSVWLDLTILLKTLPAVLLRRGAY